LTTTATATSLRSTTSTISTTVPTTVTSVSVSTTTATTTTTAPLQVVVPRQVTNRPSAVPAYASSCPDAARYSSACSCWGITATTTTVTAATITSTVTQPASATGTATSVSTVVTTLLVTETATTTGTELQSSTTTATETSTATALTGAIRLTRADNGLLFGYISRNLGPYVLSDTTANPLEALVVSIPIPNGATINDVNFDLVNQQGTSLPFLGFYVPYTGGGLESGSGQ
jgi:hypothetical protein